jgi:hypothetical protein
MFDLDQGIPNDEHYTGIGWDGNAIRPQTETLVDIFDKLAQARLQAERLNDKLFLYLLDVAIFRAHEVLEKQSDLGEHEKWS